MAGSPKRRARKAQAAAKASAPPPGDQPPVENAPGTPPARSLPICPVCGTTCPTCTPPPRTRGGQTTYTPELAHEVLTRLAEGNPLARACDELGLKVPTVIGWVRDDREGFAEPYMRAREQGWHVVAEQIIEIADDNSRDFVVKDAATGQTVSGVYVETNHDNINRARLKIDARKFMLSKMLPKVYGDKLDLNVTGNVTSELSDDKLNAMIEAYIRQCGMPPALLEQVLPYLQITVLPGEHKALPAPGGN